jgi:hypothetical protein
MMVAGVATMVAASAFAETRPAGETSWRDGDRGSVQRDDVRDRDRARRGDDSRNGRDDDRYGRDDDRYDRDDDRYDRGDRRGDSRYDRREGRSGNHQPTYVSGRVSRVDRRGDGYRVWVSGARHPFFVPERYYSRDRFRVGVVITLGGYYNPAGHYDYYQRGRRSRADLRGVIENVDRARDTFVIRDDASGMFVTVIARDRARVRRGDYVELYGDWTRRGVFRADDVDLIGRY